MIYYNETQEQEEVRQRFLDGFHLSNPGEGVKRLVYNLNKMPGVYLVDELVALGEIPEDQGDEMRQDAYEGKQMAFVLITPNMIGRGKDNPIIVNPNAFEVDEGSFHSNLSDHEYFHARDFKYGIPLPNGIVVNYENAEQLQNETLEALLDSRALLFQLLQARDNGRTDQESFQNALLGFLQYHHRLKQVGPENDFERRVVNAQIKSYQAILPPHLRD
ncbi:MAG: hypothetical protein V1740_05180 [Candidatus Woesearchaeota archaeon]